MSGVLKFFEVPELEYPASSQRISRAMSIEKMLDLLRTSELYLARPHQFTDPLEGKFTRKRFNQILEEDGSEIGGAILAVSMFSNSRSFGVCCWALNEKIPEENWELYGCLADSVGVQTDIQSLQQSIKAPGFYYMPKVEYVDFELDMGPENYPQKLIAQKHLTYDWENEVRLIKDEQNGGLLSDLDKRTKAGVRIGVDLQSLIKGIELSPIQNGPQLNALKRELNRLDLGHLLK